MLLHRCTGKGRSTEAPPGRGTRSALAAHAPIAPFSLFPERERGRIRGLVKGKRDREFLTRGEGKGEEEKRRKGKEEETSCGKESRRIHSERERGRACVGWERRKRKVERCSRWEGGVRFRVPTWPHTCAADAAWHRRVA